MSPKNQQRIMFLAVTGFLVFGIFAFSLFLFIELAMIFMFLGIGIIAENTLNIEPVPVYIVSQEAPPFPKPTPADLINEEREAENFDTSDTETPEDPLTPEQALDQVSLVNSNPELS